MGKTAKLREPPKAFDTKGLIFPGWTNYSRMVISQKMALHLHWLKCTNGDIWGGPPPNAVELQARKMDNRGSKSNTIMFVKEQRVDGRLHCASRSVKVYSKRVRKNYLSRNSFSPIKDYIELLCVGERFKKY